jgi:hypothetical protein
MCDTLCARTGDGMLFAKNSDRHPDEPQVVEWHAARAAEGALRTQYLTIPDEDAAAFLGSRPTWLWGCEHGVNEHGVAIGNEKVWTTTRARGLPSALLGMDLVRLGLERSHTADAALDVMTALLTEHGQGGSGEPHHDEPYFSSFLIADAHNGWILETSGRTWAARPVTTGAAISNRITIGTDWTRASTEVAPGAAFDAFQDPRLPAEATEGRLACTRAAVARATSAADLARTLRDHGAGNPRRESTVCMHRADLDVQTTASMIAELRNGAPPRAWVALANPCTSVFVPAFPRAVAPELADPVHWKRFSQLRDGFDDDDVRAVLDPVERELWQEADDAYGSGDREPCEQFAAHAFAPIDAALRTLGV